MELILRHISLLTPGSSECNSGAEEAVRGLTGGEERGQKVGETLGSPVVFHLEQGLANYDLQTRSCVCK